MMTLAKGHLVAVVCASVTLSACVQNGGSAGTGPAKGAAEDTMAADAAAEPVVDAGAAAPKSPLTLVERDVEAPDVFQVTDQGLWDGRPSLGGVWVAHASVKAPERVVIRNLATGKFVTGALFRREFDNPGPKIQVSSDAAEALGLLAGQPAKLAVVAVRREEFPKGGIPAEADSMPGATAVADKAGTDPVAPVAPKDGTKTDAPLPGDVAAAAASKPVAEPEKPARKGWSLFGKRKPKVPADGGEAPATSAAAGTIATQPLAPMQDPGGSKSPAKDGRSAKAPATAPAPAAPSAPAASPTQTMPATTLNRAYIQIGIFSTEKNAMTAGTQMQGAGMVATVKASNRGKALWRVIVGPVATEAERDALLVRVKGMGYPDAYPVSK